MKGPPQAFIPQLLSHSAHALLCSSCSSLTSLQAAGFQKAPLHFSLCTQRAWWMERGLSTLIYPPVFPFYTVRSQEDLWRDWGSFIQQVGALRHTSPSSLADEPTGSIIKYTPLLNDEEPAALRRSHSEPYSAQYIIQLRRIIYEWLSQHLLHPSSSSAPPQPETNTWPRSSALRRCWW